MEDTLISFETAKLAKEKGFDWNCRYYFSQINFESFELTEGSLDNYNSNYWDEEGGEWISSSTQTLLQKWLREVHNIHIDIRTNATSGGCYFFYLSQTKAPFYTLFISEKDSDTYEKALEYGLQEALKLIK